MIIISIYSAYRSVQKHVKNKTPSRKERFEHLLDSGYRENSMNTSLQKKGIISPRGASPDYNLYNSLNQRKQILTNSSLNHGTFKEKENGQFGDKIVGKARKILIIYKSLKQINNSGFKNS